MEAARQSDALLRITQRLYAHTWATGSATFKAPNAPKRPANESARFQKRALLAEIGDFRSVQKASAFRSESERRTQTCPGHVQ